MMAFYLHLDGQRIDVDDAMQRLGEMFTMKVLGDSFQIRRERIASIDIGEYSDADDDDRFDPQLLLREVDRDERENGPSFDVELTDDSPVVISGTIQSTWIKIRSLEKLSDSTVQKIVEYLESFGVGTVQIV